MNSSILKWSKERKGKGRKGEEYRIRVFEKYKPRIGLRVLLWIRLVPILVVLVSGSGPSG